MNVQLRNKKSKIWINFKLHIFSDRPIADVRFAIAPNGSCGVATDKVTPSPRTRIYRQALAKPAPAIAVLFPQFLLQI